MTLSILRFFYQIYEIIRYMNILLSNILSHLYSNISRLSFEKLKHCYLSKFLLQVGIWDPIIGERLTLPAFKRYYQISLETQTWLPNFDDKISLFSMPYKLLGKHQGALFVKVIAFLLYNRRTTITSVL